MVVIIERFKYEVVLVNNNMGVKYLIFLVVVMVLISGCYKGDKTIPIVSDVVKEAQKQEPFSKEEGEEKETVEEETKEEPKEEFKEEETEKELPPRTHTVTIKDLKLNPQELTIKRGDTVVWKHEDTWEEDTDTKHLLYQHFGEFRSPILYYGDIFNHTFAVEGIFTYQDAMYKEKNNMRGKIIVGE